jgi:hypothetical protein
MATPERPADELKVFILKGRESSCGECQQELGKGRWVTLAGEKGALCLECADLDHLEFLPSGDAALTRRARKHSTLSAVVLEWSRTRKRYERQGLLVERQALEQAERECLADADARQRPAEREAERRAELDERYLDEFAAKIRELFPGCPAGREQEIAEHACRKYSDRIGRSAAGKSLKDEALRLAVIAHIRHRETHYDELLSRGYDRWDARGQVEDDLRSVLLAWEAGG